MAVVRRESTIADNVEEGPKKRARTKYQKDMFDTRDHEFHKNESTNGSVTCAFYN